MNLKQSYNGFKKIKWENKTESQKAKVLKNQFEKLGYKVPKYLKENKISEKQLEKTLNRIQKGYEKRISKQIPNVKMSDIQYEVNKFNALVDKRLKQLKNSGFSDKAIEFLKGQHVFLTTSDRSFFANNSLLERINIDGLVANKQGRKTTLDIIKRNKQLLSASFDNVLSSANNIEDFKKLMYDEITFSDLDDNSRDYLLEKFSKLNLVQQEIVLQSYVKEIREKYKEDELVGDHLANTLNRLSETIDSVEKEI